MQQISEPNSAKQNSRLGIASTVIGIGLPLLAIFLFILFVVSGDVHKPETAFVNVLHKIFSLIFLIFGLLAPLLHLAGLILGLIRPPG